MKQRYPSLALALALVVLTSLACLRPAIAAESPDDMSAASLKLIERPRVLLHLTTTPPVPDQSGLTLYPFTFDADTSARIPAILLKRTEPASSAATSTPAVRRPLVLVLHGTGGNKEGMLPFMRELASAGFIAVAFDAPYHGARAQKKSDYTDAILRAYRAEEPHDHPFYYDTVREIRYLLDYLVTRDDVDSTRIGGIGLSKGGTELYLAAAVDPRLVAVVPCIGVQSFRWAMENDSWHSRIGTIQEAFDAAAKDAGVAPDATFLPRFYARTNPGITDRFDGPSMVPLIAPRALLVINGDSDPRTPQPGLKLCIDAIRSAYHAAGADDKFTFLLQPHTAHKVNPDSYVAAREWFVKQLKP